MELLLTWEKVLTRQQKADRLFLSVEGTGGQAGLTWNNPDAFWKFELTELNTPASFFCILTRARFTAGGAAATHEFPLSTERGGVTE